MKFLFNTVLLGLGILSAGTLSAFEEIDAHHYFNGGKADVVIKAVNENQILVFDSKFNHKYVLGNKNLKIYANKIEFRNTGGEEVEIRSFASDQLTPVAQGPQTQARAQAGTGNKRDHSGGHGDKGYQGVAGMNGTDGLNAGRIRIQAKEIFSDAKVKFVIIGQNGGNGGTGGLGGQGGNGGNGDKRGGMKHLKCGNSPGDGGDAGDGGVGGTGGANGIAGSGGSFEFMGTTDEVVEFAKTIFSINLAAGSDGLPGEGGEGGSAGAAGNGGAMDKLCGGSGSGGQGGETGTKGSAGPVRTSSYVVSQAEWIVW